MNEASPLLVLSPTLDYRTASGGWPVPLLPFFFFNVCRDAHAALALGL